LLTGDVVKYYTYVLIRPDGTPFYVGKGCGKRYLRCGNNAHAQNTYRQVVDSGQQISLNMIEAATEAEAFAEEVRLIALYGRIDTATGTLCNHSDGGEGVRVTPEQRVENGRKGAMVTQALLSREQRIENGHKGGSTTASALTPAQRREKSRQAGIAAQALLTPAQKSESGRKARKTVRPPTLEQISVRNKKSAMTRWGADAFSLDNLPAPRVARERR
jgi:hypothetical protein